MKIIEKAFFCFAVMLLLAFSHSAQASPPASLSISWRQESINWSQLEKLFSQNPEVDNFSLTFPNGLEWDMDASVIQAMHAAFMHHAQVIGLEQSEVPELSFSSEALKYKTAKGITTIPIDKFTDNLQVGEMDMLNELDGMKYNLWQYLPQWLQKFLVIIWDGMVNFCNYIAEEFKKIF